MVKAARHRIRADRDAFRAELAGRSVTFTGAGVHRANVREAFAGKHGFVYSTRVSDKTDPVVIGTAKTDTQQVAKAHELGLPILVEATFWQRLGEL